MEITGTVIGDASLRTTKKDKQVTGFTVVLNDDYKTKDGEKKEVRTFINCSYWNGPKMAAHIKKGTVVTLTGVLGINAFKSGNDEIKASLTLNTRTVKIVAWPRKAEATTNTTATDKAVDDLPF